MEFYPESVSSYRSRRLTIAIALLYVWLLFSVILFWIWRLSTGAYPNLDVPPYGSGTIHLGFCLSVVVAYVVGTTVVPRFNTVGMREGSLPSLVSRAHATAKHRLHEQHRPAASTGASNIKQPVHEFVCVEQVCSGGVVAVASMLLFFITLCPCFTMFAFSRYVNLVRSMSGVLSDCWLDVRELTPGDRVTQEIAHAAATVRCLVIFFAYEVRGCGSEAATDPFHCALLCSICAPSTARWSC